MNFSSLLCFFASALAFGVAGSLLLRHWADLRLLDPMTIKEEQHRQKRETMIRKRFDRMRAERLQPFKRVGRAIGRGFTNVYQSLEARLNSFEQAYQQVKSPFASLAPTTRERVMTLLTEGRSFMRDLKWSDAERRFLDILALDPHHVDAYKGLGQIYLKQKLYPQAQETFSFIIKMKKADDATYAALAEIEEAAEHFALAEQYRLKAVDLGMKQANRHAELAEWYTRREDYLHAWSAAKKASELEPNSAKYMELTLDLAVRLRDAKEARSRYQKLRLLAEDHQRFQSWREKVEELEAGERSIPSVTESTKPKMRRVRTVKTESGAEPPQK